MHVTSAVINVSPGARYVVSYHRADEDSFIGSVASAPALIAIIGRRAPWRESQGAGWPRPAPEGTKASPLMGSPVQVLMLPDLDQDSHDRRFGRHPEDHGLQPQFHRVAAKVEPFGRALARKIHEKAPPNPDYPL